MNSFEQTFLSPYSQEYCAYYFYLTIFALIFLVMAMLDQNDQSGVERKLAMLNINVRETSTGFFIRQDKSMISVYDEENEGNRSLYVDKILNWAKCKTPEEELNHKYQDSKTIYNNIHN